MKRQFLTTSLIWILIWVGFIELMVLNDNYNNNLVQASIIIVDINNNGNYTTIQEAIDNANNGDIIYIWDGIYYENIIINKSITLIGNSSSTTFINGSEIGDVLNITADWVNITGLNISFSGNQSEPNGDAGIKLFNVQNVHVYNNNLSNNFFGISLSNASYNTIENNSINNRNLVGIFLFNSNNNVIKNNNIILNNFSGISLYNSDSNSILNNKCNLNDFEGISLFYSNLNYIINNSCHSNNDYGLLIKSSHSNIIVKNSCLDNIIGIWIDIASSLDEYSSKNIIDENNCSLNHYGIILDHSTINNIINNTCSNNNRGIIIRDSNLNNFVNNIFKINMDDGIYLYESDHNKFEYNNISKNKNGVSLILNSEYNTFFENIVSFNDNGVSIKSGCKNNIIYHNIINSNLQQASNDEINNWDYLGEGNYWSDYKGLDNGANGRWEGDGIGDTNIPHPGPGYDNYPFIKPYGWLFPAIPELIIDYNIDSDGNYTVSWNNKSRAIGFFLEEDTDIYFSSPTNYTNGWVLENGFNIYNFTNKQEDTFYYRIKSYNNNQISDWSGIVNVTVDYLPKIPKNLQVSPVPDGNSLYIKWDLNLEDTIEYIVYFLNNSIWELIKNVTHPTSIYIHKGLIDGFNYSYKVCAIDSIGQSSGSSEPVSGIPKDIVSPEAPKNLKATAISNCEISLSWDSNTEPDLSGYFIYINESGNDQSKTFILNKTIYDKKTSCIISGLNEQVTYYFKIKAFDEVPNNSSFSDVVTATPPDETYPQAPSGLKISNVTYNSLILNWNPNPEPDIIGYFIYRSKSSKKNYENITNLINGTKYFDTDLEENTIYYYKLIAMDDANHPSLFSDYAYAITNIGPKPPEINNSISDFELLEDAIDELSINLQNLFKDINNDPLVFRCEGQNHINVTIDQETGSVILTPEENWNGEETITFYAFDGLFNVSHNITIIVTFVNDIPGPVEIIKPKNGITIIEGESLDFESICDDHDLIYGDKLTFRWTSSIDEVIGQGDSLEGVLLSVGKHKITLEVSDNYGGKAIASIIVTVQEKDDLQDTHNYTRIIIASILIIITLIILILFLFIKSKQKKLLPKDIDKGKEESVPVEPEIQQPEPTLEQIPQAPIQQCETQSQQIVLTIQEPVQQPEQIQTQEQIPEQEMQESIIEPQQVQNVQSVQYVEPEPIQIIQPQPQVLETSEIIEESTEEATPNLNKPMDTQKETDQNSQEKD